MAATRSQRAVKSRSSTPKRRTTVSAGTPAEEPPSTESPRAQSSAVANGATAGQTAAQTAAAESKISKMLTRSFYGTLMMAVFALVIYGGHLPCAILVLCLQARIFFELVKVRFKARKETSLPWFRTLQWCWFFNAMYFAYGRNVLNFAYGHNLLDSDYSRRLHVFVSFALYSMMFVFTVSSFKRGLYKYQISQLSWTLMIICIVIGQMRFVLNNIFEGLFWFVFPCALVICNDISAYFCGFLAGRKITSRPFLPRLSPNKTWEGFVGGGIMTVVISMYFSVWLSNFDWMRCPYSPTGVTSCDRTSTFQSQTYSIHLPYVGHLAAPMFPTSMRRVNNSEWHPWKGPTEVYIMDVKLMPIQVHGMAMALFASIVAPFGGFFASAIKRAYDVKDFDSVVPGHGGVMDRMDCQFIMAMCTAVHYATFIKPYSSVDAFVRAYQGLSLEQQKETLSVLQNIVEMRTAL